MVAVGGNSAMTMWIILARVGRVRALPGVEARMPLKFLSDIIVLGGPNAG
jgi:hypothetical protein